MAFTAKPCSGHFIILDRSDSMNVGMAFPAGNRQAGRVMNAACVFLHDGCVTTVAIGRFKCDHAGFFSGGGAAFGFYLVYNVTGGALERFMDGIVECMPVDVFFMARHTVGRRSG